jgi:cyclohexanone monooxygenase
LAESSEQVGVTAAAEQAWVDLLDNGVGRFLGSPDCTPGYYNNEGRPIGRRERLNGSGYPEGPVAFFDYLERWRSCGEFTGLEFRSTVLQAS